MTNAPPGVKSVVIRSPCILARARRSWQQPIYANQQNGFALLSTPSPDVQRLYLQCIPCDGIANWPDGRICEARHAGLDTGDGWSLTEGPIFQRSIVPLRSFVCQPML